jgi:DNA polymerase-3 subunit epsilon
MSNEFYKSLTRPLVFFDLETTGLDPSRDRIIEIAAVGVMPPGTLSEDVPQQFEILFDPGIPIPEGATAIHGIDDERVKGCPRFEERAADVWAFFNGCDLAGFNVRKFDIQMLLAELARHGHPLSLDGVRVVDACDIFHRREPRSLEAALRFYCDGEHQDKHIAMGDVLATMRVLEAQLERYADLPREVGALSELFVDKGAIDLAGKLRRLHGVVCINFGKYKGKPLRSMQTSYIRWMIDEQVVSKDGEGVLLHELEEREKSTRGGEKA